MRTQKDLEVLTLLTNKDGKYIPQRLLKGYLEKNGIYDYLLNRYKNNTTESFREITYRFYRDMEEPPICPICGNVIRFSVDANSYPGWCSVKCKNNDPSVKTKNAKGVSEARKREYADENKKMEIMAKRAATLKENTGVDNNGSPFSIKQYKDKANQTIKERYGYKFKSDEK